MTFIKSASGGCACNGDRTTYRLPVRLDIDIVPFLADFGEPAFDFDTKHFLKIENPKYSISGVKKMKDIKFILKDKKASAEQELFEVKLREYIEYKNELKKK